MTSDTWWSCHSLDESKLLAAKEGHSEEKVEECLTLQAKPSFAFLVLRTSASLGSTWNEAPGSGWG